MNLVTAVCGIVWLACVVWIVTCHIRRERAYDKEYEKSKADFQRVLAQAGYQPIAAGEGEPLPPPRKP